jgi:hypothetical protein
MEFIRTHTDIPVPKLLDTYEEHKIQGVEAKNTSLANAISFCLCIRRGRQ